MVTPPGSRVMQEIDLVVAVLLLHLAQVEEEQAVGVEGAGEWVWVLEPNHGRKQAEQLG